MPDPEQKELKQQQQQNPFKTMTHQDDSAVQYNRGPLVLPPEQVDQSIPKTLQREHQAFGEMLDSLSKEDEERFK
nr:hypothetical protein [Lachnospiraceae bacterium]